MRSFSSPPAPGGPSQGALTTTELVVVVVVVVVAAGLAALRMPVFGALEFIAGALYVACRSVKAMRAVEVPPFEAV
ncbi:hypothetical protein ACIA74_44345 [Streptomyces sp. NPDC051658]|uniref:hypothetical protein n=1 Tax=Streptomyces sp. NPDC051658 TaxID=3365667 RepID=UPI0037B1353C